MDSNEWEQEVPELLKRDPLWKMTVYRLSLFVADLGWLDVMKLAQDRRTWSVADQLNRALGSISANVAEGYSRGTGRDRAHFYEYALGSGREARDWCFKGRHVLGEAVARHRIALLSEAIRLLLVMVPRERRDLIRDDQAEYEVVVLGSARKGPMSDTLASLLRDIPLPELDP
jgi:four helix bundle protein